MKKRNFVAILITSILLSCTPIQNENEKLNSSMSQTTISQIQGIHHNSLYENKEVKNVVGVITGVYNSKYNKGFFMQSLTPDKDTRTSEGIFVTGPTSYKVGDVVSVDGIVKEIQFTAKNKDDLTITSIKSSNVSLIRSNEKIIAYEIKGSEIPFDVYSTESDELLPTKNAKDFYESIEGMYVVVKDPVINGFKEAHGEISILPNNGDFSKNRTNNGGVLYSYDNEQTQRILIGDVLVPMRSSSKFTDKNLTPNPGDKFESDIYGVIAYSFGNYKLYNTSELPKVIDKDTKVDTLKYSYNKDMINIASYNIENFTYDVQRSKELASQIVNIMKTPDIVGLIEVQDDDGGKNSGLTSANKTLTQLVSDIKELSGIEYKFLDVEPINNKDGGAPGANIRTAIIYRVDRLKVKNQTETMPGVDTKIDTKSKDLRLTLNPGRLFNNEEAYIDVRKPIVALFDFKGKDILVMVNHLSSKRGDLPIYGKKVAVRKSEVKRVVQGEKINEFVDAVLSKSPNTTVILMGDFNDFEFSPTLKNIKKDLLINAIEELPKNERHTYVHQGNSQVLDHILVNKEYKGKLNVDVLNINSEFTDAQGSFSDHDPVFVQFYVK